MNNKEEIIEESTEHINRDKWWYLNGELHRENDLPAVEKVQQLNMLMVENHGIGVVKK